MSSRDYPTHIGSIFRIESTQKKASSISTGDLWATPKSWSISEEQDKAVFNHVVGPEDQCRLLREQVCEAVSSASRRIASACFRSSVNIRAEKRKCRALADTHLCLIPAAQAWHEHIPR